MGITIKVKKAVELELNYFSKHGCTLPQEKLTKELLGGKGANLAIMSSLGIPVPAGVTIPCHISVLYKECKGNVPKRMALLNRVWADVDAALSTLVEQVGYMPLVSVRSGARVSMPGMMDTILNVGLTPETLPAWVERIGERAALDSYRRLIQMYGSVALGLSLEPFEEILATVRGDYYAKQDCDIPVDGLYAIINRYLKHITDHGFSFPTSLRDQLRGAVLAVFNSWDNPRAVEYRKIHGYPDNWGTAVTIQSMVFGNLNDKSATGVVFTRNPATGENVITGEFLVNAQGEDVVAGIRTPEPFDAMEGWNYDAYGRLVNILYDLEDHYGDMQDVEFTIQDGELFILQTRNGKRSPKAAVRIVSDLVSSGALTLKEALARITNKDIMAAMEDTISPTHKGNPDLTGIAAGGGVVSGVVALTSDSAVSAAKNGAKVILVRSETDPDDIAGMNASVGILTATGGLTSHAAVVARGLGKTCVVGALGLLVKGGYALIGDEYVHEGDKLTIDGSTGHIYLGEIPIVHGGMTPEIMAILSEAFGDRCERVTLHSEMTKQDIHEIVNASSRDLYLDLSALDYMPVGDYNKLVGNLLKALGKGSRANVYLNMQPMKHMMPDTCDLLTPFGLLQPMSLKAKLVAFTPAVLGIKNLVFLTGDADIGDAGPVIDQLITSCGYSVPRKVQTFADLLNSNGYLNVAPSVVESVFGSQEAFEEAVEMVKKFKGVDFSGKLPEPAYWFELLES